MTTAAPASKVVNLITAKVQKESDKKWGEW